MVTRPISIASYQIESQLLTPAEILEARLALDLSRRGLAEALLLSPVRGHERVQRWEEGEDEIGPVASQCIRLWLAVMGKGPVPPLPDKPAGGRATE